MVHLLPHHRPADAEEVPQVADDPAVERVHLAVAVLQVGDAVAGHELPGGAVDGRQVEVAAEQQQHHDGEDGGDGQRRQQEAVGSEPQIPGDARGDAGESNVKSPEQCEQLHHQVDDEPSVVPLAHAVLDPRTVVVKAADAAVTPLAVLRSHWLLQQAVSAAPQPWGRRLRDHGLCLLRGALCNPPLVSV